MNEKSLTEGAVLTALEELSTVQWGLVTTGQAKQVGIERGESTSEDQRSALQGSKKPRHRCCRR